MAQPVAVWRWRWRRNGAFQPNSVLWQMNKLFCFLWPAMVLSFQSHSLGQQAVYEVVYELLEGSGVTHVKAGQTGCFSGPDPVMTNYKLQGAFTLQFRQAIDGVSGRILNVEFVSSEGKEFSATGTGVLSDSGGGSSFLAFDLQVAQFGNIHLAGEFIGNLGKFPRISSNRLAHFGVGSCFLANIISRPVQSELPRFFRRGDVNGDDSTNITDAIAVIEFLFFGASAPECLDVSDIDDDGQIALADPVTVLGRLFLGQGPIPVPSRLCWVDPTEDLLDCRGQPACMK